jgi:hypothetical protein
MARPKTKPPARGQHRIVSYNILSSELADPKSFGKCDPGNLDAEVRIERIKEKLQDEMDGDAVIALQEVSHRYANNLHVFFHSHDYYMVTALYGNFFNGYMGVAIAVPSKYEILETVTSCYFVLSRANTNLTPRLLSMMLYQELVKVSDREKWPRHSKPSAYVKFFNAVWLYFLALLQPLFFVVALIRGVLGCKAKRPPKEPYQESKRRHNQVDYQHAKLFVYNIKIKMYVTACVDEAALPRIWRRILCYYVPHAVCVLFAPGHGNARSCVCKDCTQAVGLNPVYPGW